LLPELATFPRVPGEITGAGTGAMFSFSSLSFCQSAVAFWKASW
jgi:hypothetical protein